MLRNFYVRALSCLLLAVISNSCTDHAMPSVLPEIETLAVTSAPSGIKCGTFFSANVISVGTMPVKKFGVVLTARGVNQVHPNPVVNVDYEVVLDLPFQPGIKGATGPQVCTNEIYYRAYAILEDDTVVYGNELHFTNF
ncbi:hypothetical protein [Dyadobacter luticola]|uniref:Uncharacterized protein n=1 Tax=Dyadobacter luticola TaxID=1979387 RepID=A0A5R9KXX4_9BACT|nr:hypothetical protein [Dyadobacter luticola]TLV01021.1 hypothetical protein FEN17_16285 [Dyadobacter luticola]